MARYLYSELSNRIQACNSCRATLAKLNATPTPRDGRTLEELTHWEAMLQMHTDAIERLVKDHMPSGSGFDSGTTLDLDSSHAEKLVFNTSFHHMNEAGMYCGWTEHVVTVTPSLLYRYHLRISGRNRNDIKEYMYDVFSSALDFDLQPGMDWEATQTRTGCALDSRWEGGCTQLWYVLHDGASISPEFTSWIDAQAWAVKHFQESK